MLVVLAEARRVAALVVARTKDIMNNNHFKVVPEFIHMKRRKIDGSSDI